MASLRIQMGALVVALSATAQVACTNPAESKTPSEHEMGGKRASEVFATPSVAALAKAACEGSVDGVHEELRRGADPDTAGLWGLTPLVWALHCQNSLGVEALLSAGADPNTRVGEIIEKPTVVVLAARMTDPALLRSLLAHGGDPNAAELEGVDTALIAAFHAGATKNQWENYYLLLEEGADINKVHMDLTVAEYAMTRLWYEKLSEMLDRGYNVRLENLVPGVSDAELADSDRREQEQIRKIRRQLAAKGVDLRGIHG